MAQAQKCRLVFMGTPDFAAVILKALAQWPRGEIVAVYTQPDRPAGRGHKLTPSPVKRLAQELDLPVLQPQSLKNAEAQAELSALQADVLVVAAYGLILPDAVLAAPRLAPINVHASLLPRYRGAAPIQRAIMENWGPDAQSGVAIMRVASRLDAGPVYADAALPIGEHTAGSLHDALAHLGADLLVRVLNDLLDGRAVAREQDESRADYAAKISKEDGYIDWERPAAEVHARIRGVTPWPGAHAAFALTGEAEALHLLLAPGEVGESAEGANPGDVLHDARGLSVACVDCWYRLSLVRPQGRKDMPVRDFINGRLRGLPEGICGRALRLG
ncbi:methionyl-tRNA formyltransferase [Desulfovibrio porci]|uniref:methionyl-tRNA formyltransferase n=1 Tax=Desulfovibrio porci TaxID=2605782 RepID=UPI002A8405C4|nr:methionyl-tRNA formyltransferase [Desulfovibrio porci]MDY3809421.1 methionyl-tRNA formyltransferase [Desulfovibrio porci]